MKIITKDTLVQEQLDLFSAGKTVKVSNIPEIRTSSLKGIMGGQDTLYKQADSSDIMALNMAKRKDSQGAILLSGNYDSGFDVPFGNRGSIKERIARGKFDQDVPQNWVDLWDATRLDLSIRKQARPTIRQFFYNVVSRPNATEVISASELFPKAIIFKKNNGQGQAVNQGSSLGGQKDTIYMELFAAGYAHTLWATLFDQSNELARLNDGVAVGYNAVLDDNAMSPIITADYGTAGTSKHTAASTVGDNRQEKLYNTIIDGLDDFSKRVDPITKRKIDISGAVVLCSSYVARHVSQVINGQLNMPADSKNLAALGEISKVVAYDDEVIQDVNEAVTYSGCDDTVLYIVKPNRYMSIAQKRALTLEVDDQPNVQTLSQAQKAWYFVEGYYNAKGIENFVQKVTLPAWT